MLKIHIVNNSGEKKKNTVMISYNKSEEHNETIIKNPINFYFSKFADMLPNQ